MTNGAFIRANVLGDPRAEADGTMLLRAFLETADYRTLIETSDRLLVVGRRGTGKSALTLRLEKYWAEAKATHVVKLAPEEHHVIGSRPLVQSFGDKFSRVRAGTRLVWRYALMLETIQCLSPYLKFSGAGEFDFLKDHLNRWMRRGPGVFDRFRNLMHEVASHSQTPEERIGDLPIALDLTNVEEALANACEKTSSTVIFLIDRLDEGYEPDDTGVGFVDGLVQAAIDVKTRLPHIRPVVFLRDNIHRAVEALDPDYSRNLEGHVLRLHWDENALLSFAAARLKIAFGIQEDSSLQIWNQCASGELKNQSGFARCLQFTLYRPRDLLAILNDAFYAAGKGKQTQLNLEHLESTAKIISQNRLNDLRKEYGAIIPGLEKYIGVLQGKNPEQDVVAMMELIEGLLSEGSEDSLIQQDFLILEDAKSVIRELYSVGFLGVRDRSTRKFIFCHDGRAPDREFTEGDKILVHPCYWMALNCTRNQLAAAEAEEIYDEYDIEVSSETPTIRNNKINELIQHLGQITHGSDGDTAFELWCQKAIRICFAKGLRNVEFRPNKHARQRRDIVATNLGEGDVWHRIYDDYGTRQVTFEVKNYEGLQASDYQQVLSYLGAEYGRLAFVITRDETVDLFAKRDVEWVRDLYLNHKALVIKLTGKYFTKLLYKLRNPQRHDDVDNALHKLLDTYTRLYLAGQTTTEGSQEKRRKQKEARLARKMAKKGGVLAALQPNHVANK